VIDSSLPVDKDGVV
jgi:hypothetical protein